MESTEAVAKKNAVAYRAKEGDQAALSTLITTHYPLMLRVATRVVFDAAAVEDVVQMACIQVMRGIAQFRGDAPIGAWITQVVVQTARWRHRHERSVASTAQAYVERNPHFPEGHEEQTGRREILALVSHVLSTGREGDLELFTLRYGDDIELPDLSELTGISETALKSRFDRARKRIRTACLEQNWGVKLGT